jgi:hypothetical protein
MQFTVATMSDLCSDTFRRAFQHRSSHGRGVAHTTAHSGTRRHPASRSSVRSSRANRSSRYALRKSRNFRTFEKSCAISPTCCFCSFDRELRGVSLRWQASGGSRRSVIEAVCVAKIFMHLFSTGNMILWITTAPVCLSVCLSVFGDFNRQPSVLLA